MAAAKAEFFQPSQIEALTPLPVRYLQLPTIVVKALQEYFVQPDRDSGLPGSAHLRYYGQDAIDQNSQLENALEIYRLEEQRGDRSTTHPKVLVRRGAVGIRRRGVSGGMRQGMPTPTTIAGNVVALEYFGTVVCFCLARTPGQSEFLAAEVEQFINHFAQQMRQQLNLIRLIGGQVGDIGELEGFDNFFATPVVVDYIYEDNPQIVRQGFPTRSIVLDIK